MVEMEAHITQGRVGWRWKVAALETEAGVGRRKRGTHRPVEHRCNTGKGVGCVLLGTSVIKGKFFSKIGEEHVDDRKREWSQDV